MAKESSSNRKPAKPTQRKTKSADVSRDLDARPQDIEKVKGGKKKLEDPCQGGELGIIRR